MFLSKKQQHYKGFYVSTVFLVFDHGTSDDKPLWFETMVLKEDEKGDIDWRDEKCWRCETWQEAEEQHEHAKRVIDRLTQTS